MSRRTRKQMVGKPAENKAIADNERFIHLLQRLVKREFWSQQRGQIPACEVLPQLCPHEQRRRERARREFLAMDPFEHREE